MQTIKAEYESSRCLKEPKDGASWGVHSFWCDLHGLFTAPGVLDRSSMVSGLSLELHGDWESSKYGKQFKISRYSKSEPKGRDGIAAFLRQASGIGLRISQDLYDKFGDGVIELLINKPEEVAAGIPSLTAEVAKLAAETLAELYTESKLTIPIVDLLAGIGFPKSLPKQIIVSRTADPISIIKRNPYWLMKFKCVGFNRCDQLRKKLKLPVTMPERYEAAAFQVFKDKSDTVWVHYDDVRKEVANFLTVGDDTAVQALRGLYMDGKIKKEDVYLSLTTAYNDEVQVSRLLAQKTLQKGEWPDLSQLVGEGIERITTHQYEEATKAFKNGRVAFLLGSPGTGKTHTATKIIENFKGIVAAAAPTGKAAQRMEQMMRKIGVPASTIHTLLEPVPSGDGWIFRITGGGNVYISADLIVIDEVSMLDNWLGRCLLVAIAAGTHILFIGDPNQLSPVGRGSMLRDWKKYADDHPEQTTYGELREIKRNAGRIVEACAEIRDGKVPDLQYAKEPGVSLFPNLQMAMASNDREMVLHLKSFVANLKAGRINLGEGKQLDLLRDVQFLVSVNKDSPISRDEVNKFLRREFNPGGKGEHAIYKVGDKVICTSNSKVPEWDKETKREKEGKKKYVVTNGSLGLVRESYKKRIVVEMYSDPGRLLVVATGDGKGDWDHGFAITGHKSQGSEWQIVFVFLGNGFRINKVISREWIFTCLSRPQTLGVVCGNKQMLRDAIRRVRMWDRKSFFEKWMTQGLQELVSVS